MGSAADFGELERIPPGGWNCEARKDRVLKKTERPQNVNYDCCCWRDGVPANDPQGADTKRFVFSAPPNDVFHANRHTVITNR